MRAGECDVCGRYATAKDSEKNQATESMCPCTRANTSDVHGKRENRGRQPTAVSVHDGDGRRTGRQPTEAKQSASMHAGEYDVHGKRENRGRQPTAVSVHLAMDGEHAGSRKL